MALLQPWIGPSFPGNYGVPIGVDLRTGKVVLFDPWWMKSEGYIDSTVIGVIGDKDHGKSTLIKSLLIRLSGRHGGIDELTDEELLFRCFVNDQKPENGKPEYGDVSEFLCSIPYRLNRPNLVNIFDPKMFKPEDEATPYNLLELTTDFCAEIAGHPMKGLVPMVFQIAVSKMCDSYGHVVSPEMLLDILQNPQMSDVKQYRERSRQKLLSSFGEELRRQAELYGPSDTDDEAAIIQKLGLGSTDSEYIDESEYRAACTQASVYVGQLLEEFGGVFGGNRSMVDILSEEFVTFDWTGVEERTRGMLAAYFWRIRRAALHNNELHLIPNMEVRDEAHEDRFNVVQIRYQSSILKKARAFHTFQIDATQHIHDYLEAGDEGSERRGLMEGIVRSHPAWFIAHQPRDAKTRAFLRQWGCSRADIEFMMELPIGCHAFMRPGKQPVFFKNVLTPTELTLIGSNKATERMVRRRQVLSPDGFMRQAEEYGVLQLGEEG